LKKETQIATDVPGYGYGRASSEYERALYLIENDAPGAEVKAETP